MLFTSGKSLNYPTQEVFDFFTAQYPIKSDVEVFHTDLTGEFALGFTEANGNEQFIQIDKQLNFQIHVFHLKYNSHEKTNSPQVYCYKHNKPKYLLVRM